VVNADDFHAFERADSSVPSLEARQAFDDEIQPWELPVDIGPTTVERMRSLINDAQTVLWNGPLGIAEIERFAEGTRQVAGSLLENKTRAAQRTVICGESLSRVLRESDLSIEAIRHVSTGGESALQLLAGWPLPAVAALSDAGDASPRNRQLLRKLLLPVDDSEHSLNAVSRIGEFVDAEAAEITLLYVQKPLTRVFRDEERQRQLEIERMYQAERVFAAANAALARQGLNSRRQLTMEGKPATEILRCADEIAADLILMGARGRSGLAEILRSGVSQTVSKRARCPVLIVRIPDEEVSKAA
jgi:nucleotide-binding universal stress UspA family protein